MIHWIFTIALCICAPLLAGESASVMEQINELMNEAEYDRAKALIARQLPRLPPGSPTRANLHWLEAVCAISLGKEHLANASFQKLLEINPAFSPTSLTSPKIVDAYRKVRTQFAASGRLNDIYQPQLMPFQQQQSGMETSVIFRIGNTAKATDIARAILFIRELGDSDYTAIDLTRDVSDVSLFSGRIPVQLLETQKNGGVVEYYLETYSQQSVALCSVGKADLPLSFVITKPLQSIQVNPLTKPILTSSWNSWPLWLSAAIVTIGGIILGTALLSASDEGAVRVIVHPEG